MRGEQEQRCLDFVKKAIFYNGDKPIQNPFTHKTYLDVSNDEFLAERFYYISPNCHKFYFGLSETEQAEIENSLRIAHTNPNASLFPDFLLENGFIEHFKITSSSLTRKGATHTKKENEFLRTIYAEQKKLKQSGVSHQALMKYVHNLGHFKTLHIHIVF